VTATPVPPELPAVFTTTLLNPNDKPHAYIKDTCQELKLRWDPNNSAPGAVVMPIMIHGVAAGDEAPPRPDIDTNHNRLEILMRDLNQQGFVTITTQQLFDFLDHNAKIPARSVIFVIDDRHYADYFNTHFIPFLQQYGWKTVTNAFIAATDTNNILWQDNAQLAASGWVDYQAHGVIHNTPVGEYSPDEYINSELLGSIAGLQQHFGVTPIAYIWPGGGFTSHAVDLAVKAGYKIGFTVNPRGPLMFNWLPLSDATDPMRPSYTPEGTVSDLLMVLPRYWVTDADLHIDEVRIIGQQAAEYAQANKETELQYYNIVCQPILGPIPTLTP
jgi:peptidoglycan/xylan/chitin deacetylase (PgdA/CDA1 family)